MDSMIESVIHNLMTIHANATILKNIAARIGSTVSAVRIARRDPPVHRVRWVREVRQALKVFPESEVRWVRKALKESPALLAPRGLSVKPGQLDPKAPPVLLVLRARKVLQALPGLLVHRDLLAKLVPLVLRVLRV